MKRFPIVGLAVSLTLLTGTTVAQDSEGLEEIVVTATKREQTLQDVPVAVSVTTVETINKASIQDVSDLASIIPSLRVTTLQTSTNTNFVIRGFGNGANNPGIEPSVGVFIDGVYRSRSAGAIGDLIDVSRVEVLRGPQSTLFGQNASAGVISVITQKPQFGPGSGLVELTLGNYNQTIVKAKIGGSINGSDSLAYSLSFVNNERDGYFINQTDNTRINDRDRWDFRGQLLWKASDNVEARLIVDSSKIDEVCCGVSNLINGPTGAIVQSVPVTQYSAAVIGAVRAVAGNSAADSLLIPVYQPINARIYANDPFGRSAYLNKAPQNIVENNGVSAHFDWTLNEVLSLASITALRAQKTDFDYDFDFTGAQLGTTNRNEGDIDTFSQELRLNFDGGGAVRGLVGLYLMKEEVAYRNTILLGSNFRAYAAGLVGVSPANVTSINQLATGLQPVFTALNAPQLSEAYKLAILMNGGEKTLRDLETAARATGLIPATGSFFAAGSGNVIDTDQETDANTVFGQVDVDLSDRLTMTAGVAFTSTDKVVNFRQQTTELFSGVNLETLGVAVMTQRLAANGVPLATAQALSTNAKGVACFGGAASFPAGPLCNPLLPTLSTQLNASGRYTILSQGLYGLQFLHPVVPFSDRSDDSDQTFTFRLAYDLTDAVNIYGGVSTGYKATSWNLSRDSKDPDTAPVAAPNYKWYPRAGTRKAEPEEATVIELGLKARLNNFAAYLAVFDQEIKNFQTNIFTGTGFNLANAGVQSTKGLEIETQWKINDAWQVDLAATFLDPKYDSFKNAENEQGPVDLTGFKPAGIHEQSISAGVNYLWSLGGIDGFVRADYLYESAVQISENVDKSRAGREVNTLNASIGFKAAGVDVLVWGRNLNDDQYLLSAFPSVAQSGSFSGYPNQPRTYGVTLRKEF